MIRDMTLDCFGIIFIPMEKRGGHLKELTVITTSRIMLRKLSCNKMKFQLESEN